jgi:hypothetical protein
MTTVISRVTTAAASDVGEAVLDRALEPGLDGDVCHTSPTRTIDATVRATAVTACARKGGALRSARELGPISPYISRRRKCPEIARLPPLTSYLFHHRMVSVENRMADRNKGDDDECKPTRIHHHVTRRDAYG